MSISSTNRKAGPYACDDATVAFPFAFKVFSTADVRVVLADADGVESDLLLGTNYSVALNSDQDASPGGTVTTTVAYAVGYTVTLTSQVQSVQPVVLTNAGGFYPRVINDAFDRVTILVQQLAEQVGRAVKVGISSAASPDTLMAQLAGYVTAALGYSNSAASSAATASSSAVSAASSASDAAASVSNLNAGNLTSGTIPDARFPALYNSNLLATGSNLVGYGAGSGGTVTQATNKFTAVTLNKPTGRITTANDALASGTTANFILNNSLLTATSVLVLNIVGGVTDVRNYTVAAGFNGAGSVQILVRNISGGSLSEALQIQYVVISGATS